MTNRIPIKYKNERAIFSDVLPYEIPVIFSNRHFYRFLIANKIAIDSKKNQITWCSMHPGLAPILKLMFGINTINQTTGTLGDNALKTIPFVFKIAHKDSDFRELSIIHPINQLHLVEFYNEYKELIKYYSSISRYSIRRPCKVAKFRFKNDYLHKVNKAISPDFDRIELEHAEYENLKTFFTYKKYSSIHRFFESHQYQNSEKKFKGLYKFDISKCFDSIYTHSIVWALQNKMIVKDNIGKSKKTFSGQFDKFMQNINYGETNGILIGSEFARIFSEILLQQVDKIVFNELSSDLNKITHGVDYKLYRYVDDFFVFFNDDLKKDKIVDTFRHNLREFNLHISESKSSLYRRPIITELSIAKTKITTMINETFSTIEIEGHNEKKWRVKVDSRTAIVDFKIIIKETGIEYKDILNYTISLIERRMISAMERYQSETNKFIYMNDILKFSFEVIHFSFFIYSVSPRVSATVKITSLLSKLIVFYKESTDFTDEDKNYIFKKIYLDSRQILEQNKIDKHRQIENLYLIIILSEIGKKYRLEEDFIRGLFFDDINVEREGLNYFVIVTLLFYIKNISRYFGLKELLLLQIKKTLSEGNKDYMGKRTEAVIMLFDVLSCPYIDDLFKNDILDIFSVDVITKPLIINYCKQKYWFIKWTDFDLVGEIEAKKSQEAYS